jgi:hypothetical protein
MERMTIDFSGISEAKIILRKSYGIILVSEAKRSLKRGESVLTF